MSVRRTPVADSSAQDGPHRNAAMGVTDKAVVALRGGIEGIVLVLVCVSPWAFGGTAPRFELALYAGLAGLLALWAARTAMERRLSWKKCPVAVCLALLFAVGLAQIVPLPNGLLEWISPSTSRLYDQLLPSQPEALPDGEPKNAAAIPVGSTISLYPDATRLALVRLLAVFLLFAVVRNNSASAGALRRLSIAALVSGAALSLFGLVQFFTSPHDVLYWTYPSAGQVFGPFVNRNHFAFYVNVCVGLGVGLLLSRSIGSQPTRDGSRTRDRRDQWGLRTPLELLRDPQALWIAMALALMIAGVVFCVSRGGILALLGAAVTCLVFGLVQFPRWRAGGVLLTVAIALALLSWFGWERIEARLSTLWTGEALQDDRVALLPRAWRAIQEFPVWGTGYGTFQYIEPLYLHKPQDVGWVYEHAHNEYLEALIEGGTLRLMLSVLIIGWVLRLGHRAVRLHRRRAAAALALGALFGFTTIVVHSFVEFGLHMPAVALLATVLSAQICALGRDEVPSSDHRLPVQQTAAFSGEYSLRLFGFAPLLAAAAALWIGLVLVWQGWKTQQVDRLRVAADRLNSFSEPSSIERQIVYLEAAARLASSDAALQLELAQAHFDLYEEQTRRRGATDAAESHDAQRHLVRALAHFLQARDLCPIMALPHVRLAANVDEFERADPRRVYMKRAQHLAPADPQLWYFCGLAELLDEQQEQAWTCWRRSLELSDRFLPHILDRASRHLGPLDLRDRILPDRPGTLLAAASHRYPSGGPGTEQTERQPLDDSQRRLFLRKALALLERQTPLTGSADLGTKAELHSALGEEAEAVEAYQAALALDPGQVKWRFALAKHLYEQGRIDDARFQLRQLLIHAPQHREALTLLNAVARQLAERKVHSADPHD